MTRDTDGTAFAEELLFVQWIDGDYYGARRPWVADCPNGVDPRSPENPYAFTWEETLESDWGDGPEEAWYVVGARNGWWLGVDFDVGEGHAEVVDFEIDDIRIPAEGSLLALTPTGGAHAYILLDEEPPAMKTDYAGVDLLSDSSNVRQAGAISPWHDDDRRVVNDPAPVRKDDAVHDRDDWSHLFSVEGREEPVLVERDTDDTIVELDIPDEAPDDVPLCVGQLLEVRSSGARYDYPGSPFAVDTHLGMMLCSVGYSIEDAVALLEEYPPAKNTGFDPDETRYQLDMLYSKMRSGDMSPPTKKLRRAGIDVDGCDCAFHGCDGRGEGTAIPMTLSKEGTRRRSNVAKHRAENDVRRALGQPIDDGLIYHAPQGLGKTRYVTHGASEQPRLVITTNKGEHRDSIEYFAGEAGVTTAEIVPFGDSWLCSDASPVADECLELYRMGVMPKFITAEYGDVMPEEVDCPYLEQFEGEPPDVDLLMGSPGHENVSRFRHVGVDDDDPIPRAVVYDDVNPADREINENSFTVDGARAELNELLQELPQIPADSVSELMRNRDARNAVERVAVGDGNDGPGEDTEPASDDVWEALDAAAAEDDAIRVDIVDVVRRRENVRGDTVIKLKVLAGAEVRGIRAFSWRKDGTEHFSWVAHPDLSGHDVAVLSATHVPHVTEEWMARADAGPVVHRTAADDWEAVRRAQGYLLIQTRSARNSRSGAGAYHEDPAARRESMREDRIALRDAIERAEGQAPGVIDSKKLLDEDGDSINFGRVWSNNRHRNKSVGLVAGATYFGDDWVEARAAYCGRTIEIEHAPGRKAWCEDEVGSDLLDYMVTTWVEQAATRFGRSDDVDEVRVYVDTAEVPPGFPAVDASDRIVRTTSSQQEVYEAVTEGAETLNGIAERVTVGRRQVGNIVWELEELGLLSVERLALENGGHLVGLSGNSPISLNTVRLPEIDRGSPIVAADNAPDTEKTTITEESSVQTTLRGFNGPGD